MLTRNNLTEEEKQEIIKKALDKNAIYTLPTPIDLIKKTIEYKHKMGKKYENSPKPKKNLFITKFLGKNIKKMSIEELDFLITYSIDIVEDYKKITIKNIKDLEDNRFYKFTICKIERETIIYKLKDLFDKRKIDAKYLNNMYKNNRLSLEDKIFILYSGEPDGYELV